LTGQLITTVISAITELKRKGIFNDSKKVFPALT